MLLKSFAFFCVTLLTNVCGQSSLTSTEIQSETNDSSAPTVSTVEQNFSHSVGTSEKTAPLGTDTAGPSTESTTIITSTMSKTSSTNISLSSTSTSNISATSSEVGWSQETIILTASLSVVGFVIIVGAICFLCCYFSRKNEEKEAKQAHKFVEDQNSAQKQSSDDEGSRSLPREDAGVKGPIKATLVFEVEANQPVKRRGSGVSKKRAKKAERKSSSETSKDSKKSASEKSKSSAEKRKSAKEKVAKKLDISPATSTKSNASAPSSQTSGTSTEKVSKTADSAPKKTSVLVPPRKSPSKLTKSGKSAASFTAKSGSSANMAAKKSAKK